MLPADEINRRNNYMKVEPNIFLSDGKNIVLSFSGGRTSAFMTIECLKLPRFKNAVVIFSNTGKEEEETLIFVDKCDKYLQEHFNKEIIWIEYDANPEIWFNVVDFGTASRKGEPFASLILKRKYTPNRVARFCTQDLKIRPMKKFCQQVLGWKHWINMVGIRYDEPRRWSKSKSVTRSEVFDVEHILVGWKIVKPFILDYFKKMPFDLQLEEHEGNCDVCFLKGKKKKQAIARKNPEKFDWWIDMEKAVNGRFMSDYGYDFLRDFTLAQQTIDFDDTISCFCGD